MRLFVLCLIMSVTSLEVCGQNDVEVVGYDHVYTDDGDIADENLFVEYYSDGTSEYIECPVHDPYFNCVNFVCSYERCPCSECSHKEIFNTNIIGNSLPIYFSGNQVIHLYMKNSNVLGCAGTIECMTTNQTKTYILLPFGNSKFRFDILGNVPIWWKFVVNTISDVATIFLRFGWRAF